MRILGRKMRQLPRNASARRARARDPEAAIFFLLRIPRPKGQIASILVSTALKPQLPKSRQLNGARHDETHPPLRRSSDAAKDVAFESGEREISSRHARCSWTNF